MNTITGLYFYKDGAFLDSSELNLHAFEKGVVIYEVVRIDSGVALFIEDHIRRFEQSLSLSDIHYPLIPDNLRNSLFELMQKNGLKNGNVKIILHISSDGSRSLYAFFIPHFYPSASMYMHGVDVDLFKAERTDPNIKKLHAGMIQRITAFILNHNIYDVLLVDENKCVTEGSKTNIFFIRGKIVYTAPADKVLKGITRQKLFQLCADHQIKLIEKDIPLKCLTDFDAAFFTGTSPKILPIRRIAEMDYQVSNPVMRSLINAYDSLLNSYIADRVSD